MSGIYMDKMFILHWIICHMQLCEMDPIEIPWMKSTHT